MRPYPAYKASGVEWLGEVPEGWKVGALKRSCAIFGVSTPRSDVSEYWDGDIPWATPADLSGIRDRFIRSTARQITRAGLKACGTTLVDTGAIILSTRAPIGSIAIAAEPICTNQGCKSLVPEGETSSDFFYYVLLASTGQLNVLGRGSTFLELSGDQLAAFEAPLPPLSEQRAIAGFLDRETAKIDALVAEQRRLIALLAEKRQAVISHAVTRGLNPDARLNPSGIDWLGDVSEGWEVVKLGAACERLTYGFTNPMPTTDEGPFLVTAADIEGGRIKYDGARKTSERAFRELLTDKSRPVAGDVLLTKDGTLGRVAVADGAEACIVGDLTDSDQLSYAMAVKGKLLENARLVQQAGSNMKEQFANSPALTRALTDAIIDALDAHGTMSKQALESPAVQAGLKDALMGPGRLYEDLRNRAA